MKFILSSVLLVLAVTVEAKKSQEIVQKCVRETKISLEEVGKLGEILKGKPKDDLKSLKDAAKETIGGEKVEAFIVCMRTNIVELLAKCVEEVAVTDDEKTKLQEVLATVLESTGGTRKAAAEEVVKVLGPERAEKLSACSQKTLSD